MNGQQNPLPDGIYPAERCSVAELLDYPHGPHLWAWSTSDPSSWRDVDPYADIPPRTLWCDGQAGPAECHRDTLLGRHEPPAGQTDH